MTKIALGLITILLIIFSQPTSEVELAISTYRKEISPPESVVVVVILKNNTDNDIENVSFTFLNKEFKFVEQQSLPKIIAAKSTATGSYTVTIDHEGVYELIGVADYNYSGKSRASVAQTEVSIQSQPWVPHDLLLLLIGAVVGVASSVIGGFLTEVGKGLIEDPRKSDKALSVLIPTMEACRQAVDDRRNAPIELWQEVYFKEGLYTALARRARRKGQPQVSEQITQLYALMRMYNEDSQRANREDVLASLDSTLSSLRQLL